MGEHCQKINVHDVKERVRQYKLALNSTGGHFLDVVGRMGLANSAKDVFKRELNWVHHQFLGIDFRNNVAFIFQVQLEHLTLLMVLVQVEVVLKFKVLPIQLVQILLLPTSAAVLCWRYAR
ncbi:hypothetical protein Salat_1141900 [Sesamum alatum]|uniref:Uncharacterized protein n=1 Tax=Sesamum alatum TaxID=300844 RepID=A0AAE1YE48_9LAMI|nr:hypothetical protein Salat_1141900 [Sesamum alatum]